MDKMDDLVGSDGARWIGWKEFLEFQKYFACDIKMEKSSFLVSVVWIPLDISNRLILSNHWTTWTTGQLDNGWINVGLLAKVDCWTVGLSWTLDTWWTWWTWISLDCNLSFHALNCDFRGIGW